MAASLPYLLAASSLFLYNSAHEFGQLATSESYYYGSEWLIQSPIQLFLPHDLVEDELCNRLVMEK